MATVAQVLNSKPDHTTFMIADTASVYEAIAMMAEKHIGALIVTHGEVIVGIMTERDYASKVVLMDRVSRQTSVREIMTSQVRFVRPDQTTDDCMALMTERRMRHLPVIDGEKLVGMISIGNLVKNIISEQQLTIHQLERYIFEASTCRPAREGRSAAFSRRAVFYWCCCVCIALTRFVRGSDYLA
ncbi:MAG: CBS domain protein [uncultured Caballeronia sp.]|nr:MAG: CBS domain protein [uncultured Caballeronia sp.]